MAAKTDDNALRRSVVVRLRRLFPFTFRRQIIITCDRTRVDTRPHFNFKFVRQTMTKL